MGFRWPWGLGCDLHASSSLGFRNPTEPKCRDSVAVDSLGTKSEMKFMVGGFQRSLKGEDCFATRQDIIRGDSITCILVADGHGGSHVSTYISSRVLQQICASAADGSAAALNVACNAVFKKVHEEVCSSKFDTGERKAGSTLTVICVNATRGEVSCWNVGDSMALLVENEGYIELGVSHRLEENQQEQARVVAQGAMLGRAIDPSGQPGGPMRAFPGGLAVTRGIGDADCAAFVLPEPSFVTRKVPPMGGALVACSDGVWDHLSAQEAAAVLISGDYSDGKTAAAKVVKTAISKRGLTDDTTACAILFGPSLDDGSKEGHRPNTVKDGFESVERGSFLRRVKSPEVSVSIEDEDSSKEHSVLGRMLKGVRSRSNSADAVFAVADPSLLARMVPEPANNSPLSTPINQRPPGKGHEMSVKAGNAFRTYESAGEPDPPGSSFEPSEMSTDGATVQVTRCPPVERQFVSWDDAIVTSGSSNAGLVKHGDKRFESSPPRNGGTPARGSGSPNRRSKSNTRGFSLAGLFDHVVVGRPTGSGDMDGSKMDGSKTLDDDEGVLLPWAVSHSMKKRPIAMRNADPTRGWHSDAEDCNGNAVENAAGKAVGSGFATIRDEESDLRGVQLTVKGKLPEQVRAVEWASLGEMKYLGEGEFATAHMTTLDGEKVAIKMLKPAKQDSMNALRGIKREIMLMTLMDHPNVLNAYALGQREGKPFVIIELLATVLNKELPRDPDTVPFWVRWREVKAWPLVRALNCGLQLARALQYCHDDAFPGYLILHRDVKPNNIGFLATGELVLFDFGLASLWRHSEAFDDTPRKLTGECGSMRYMAPEVANSQDYNHKAEVYSFASVLWEMCSHRKPFLEFSSPELFKKAVARGFHPKINPKWPADLKSFLEDCWALEISERPEFREVVPRLEQLLHDQIVATCDQKKPLKPGFGYPSDSLISASIKLSA